ncbi:MAG: hypothetical protein FJ213_07835 [Ignavibacteria bacterium]|nr:hypothetical protein [Ignavibacteria bacterium]
MNSFKTFYLLNRQKLLIALSTFLVILGAVNIYHILIVNQMSNDECIWLPTRINKDSTALHFDVVKVDGVTWNAGIRNGDRLIAINGVSTKSATIAQNTLNKVDAGKYAEYVVERNGKIFKTKVLVKKLIQYPNLGFGLLAFIWLVFGFIVIMAKPDGLVQKLFYRIGAVYTIYMSAVLIPLGSRIEYNVYSYFLLIPLFAQVYLPTVLVHFFFVFPKPFKFIEKKWVVRILYLAPLIAYAASLMIIYLVFTTGNVAFYSRYFGILNILFLVALIVGFVSLLIKFKNLKTKDARRPLFLIVIAYAIGLTSVIYTSTIANAIADSFFNSPELFAPIILVAIIPIAFGVSIFKYQLMDVSIVIKNAIIYGVATIIVAAVYFLVIYLIGLSISEAIGTEYQGIIAGLIFITFAVIFQSTKDNFQDLLTRKFYPEQFAYQKVLVKFSTDLPGLVGLENILDSITDTFEDSLKIKKFGLLLKNDQNEFILKRNFGLHNQSVSPVINESFFNDFLWKKRTISNNCIIEQEDFKDVFENDSSLLIEEEIHSIVPMMIKSKIIGFILLGLKPSGSKFAGKDIEILCAVASQAAVSIENAKLYKKEVHRLALERDLENARKIQQGLLPRCIPSMQGLDICGEMIPAFQVGGDYYDLIQISPSKIFVLVGDVSGKGLPASLIMTKLQSMIQLYCSADKSPKDILVEANRKLYNTMDRNWFVTLSLGLFDTEKKMLTYCRAGHPNLLYSSNGFTNYIETSGIGLGLEQGDVFQKSLEEKVLTLKKNDVFVFYSDGVSEAMNSNHDMYGFSNLSETVEIYQKNSATEILRKIINSLSDFRGEHEQTDDISLVVVKVNF